MQKPHLDLYNFILHCLSVCFENGCLFLPVVCFFCVSVLHVVGVRMHVVHGCLINVYECILRLQMKHISKWGHVTLHLFNISHKVKSLNIFSVC